MENLWNYLLRKGWDASYIVTKPCAPFHIPYVEKSTTKFLALLLENLFIQLDIMFYFDFKKMLNFCLIVCLIKERVNKFISTDDIHKYKLDLEVLI